MSSKGTGKKFTLNKKSYELLCNIPDNSYETEIFKSPGKYLKAIFETYARLPYLQREEIFFHEILSEIEDSIRLKRTIRITTGARQYEVLPYLITTDTLSAYHYLVGLSHPVDADDSADLCASFRISRIRKVQMNRNDQRLLKAEEKKQLDEQISEKGVQFLLTDVTKIRIRLSDEGVRKYHSQVHLRPPYQEKSDDNIFEFRCTSRQIEAYFFKFGKDAEILEPLDLKEKFAAEYKSAADLYEKKLLSSS